MGIKGPRSRSSAGSANPPASAGAAFSIATQSRIVALAWTVASPLAPLQPRQPSSSSGGSEENPAEARELLPGTGVLECRGPARCGPPDGGDRLEDFFRRRTLLEHDQGPRVSPPVQRRPGNLQAPLRTHCKGRTGTNTPTSADSAAPPIRPVAIPPLQELPASHPYRSAAASHGEVAESGLRHTTRNRAWQ